jgi:hypothetical protein
VIAETAGTAVDLIKHAPLIDHVEEAVFGERRRLEVLVVEVPPIATA